jgi:hypothetical protein
MFRIGFGKAALKGKTAAAENEMEELRAREVSEPATYAGVTLLLAASIWNLAPRLKGLRSGGAQPAYSGLRQKSPRKLGERLPHV